MDNKKFVTLILFILTYDVLKYDTRYVLMCLMEYQYMFKLEETFNVSPYCFYEKFDINRKKLAHILEYLNKAGWITCTEEEKYYTVTINYEKIENVRTCAINYYKKMKEKQFIKN